MRPTVYGKLVKIGPGHWKVVWPTKRGPKPKAGRPKGGRRPVPKEEQESGLKYCRYCDRTLNTDNASGFCRTCT